MSDQWANDTKRENATAVRDPGYDLPLAAMVGLTSMRSHSSRRAWASSVSALFFSGPDVGDLHVELFDSVTDLEDFDTLEAGTVLVGSVLRYEEGVSGPQGLASHDGRAADDVVQAIGIVGVAGKREARA